MVPPIRNQTVSGARAEKSRIPWVGVVPLVFVVLVPTGMARGEASATTRAEASEVVETQPGSSRLSDTQIVEWLKALKPLPKIHYSWPLQAGFLDNPNDPRFFQYVRLTHAASFRGETVTSRQIEAAVIVCKYVNATEPSIPATLAINYSPWHRRFGKDLPATDTGPTHDREIEYFRDRMILIKEWLAKANARHKTDVRVSALLLDSERFHVKPGNTAWNDAMTAKYRAIYDVGREIFPETPVHWYARGAWIRCASRTGWGETRWFTLEEPGDSFSCSLYRIVELGYMRETFRRTVENAAKHGVDDVIPWVALGSGYRRQTDTFNEWSRGDWDYDLIYSWQLGLEINNKWYGDRPKRFAPWNAAKVVIFYPGPFSRDYKCWPKHFVAYVRGANGVRTLPE